MKFTPKQKSKSLALIWKTTWLGLLGSVTLSTGAAASTPLDIQASELLSRTHQELHEERAWCAFYSIRTGFDFTLAPLPLPTGAPFAADLIWNTPWKGAKKHCRRVRAINRIKKEIKGIHSFIQETAFAYNHLENLPKDSVEQPRFWRKNFSRSFRIQLTQLSLKYKAPFADVVKALRTIHTDGAPNLVEPFAPIFTLDTGIYDAFMENQEIQISDVFP